MLNKDLSFKEQCNELKEKIEQIRPENVVDMEKVKAKAEEEKKLIQNIFKKDE